MHKFGPDMSSGCSTLLNLLEFEVHSQSLALHKKKCKASRRNYLCSFIRISHGNGIIGPHCHFLVGLVGFTAQPENGVSNYIVNANGLTV